MLHQSLFFLGRNFTQVDLSQLVYEIKLNDCILKTSFGLFKLFDNTLDNTPFVLKLLIASDKFVQVFLLFILGLGKVGNFFGQFLKLLLTTFTLGSSNSALHLLNLEISVVKKLLLTCLLVLQFSDIGLQVTTG